MSETPTIADGSVVTMHYKLALDDGQVVDSSEGNDPLAYLHGSGNIVPGLESAMAGKEVGASFDVSVTPEEGYGPRHDQAVQKVPRGAFPRTPSSNRDPVPGTERKSAADHGHDHGD